MKEQRIVILDASHSLFPPNDPLPLSSGANSGSKNTARPLAKSTYQGENILGLQRIPGFDEIVLDAIRDASSTSSLGRIAAIDVGVVCDTSAVRALGRAIHDRVKARLKD